MTSSSLRRHGDRGASLLIGVAALALVAVLGAALLTEAQAGVRRAERLVDRTEGDHLVEVAVAAAWTEIVEGATDAFTDEGEAVTGEWRVSAVPADGRWSLEIETHTDAGRVDGRVTVSREALVPHTLVVNTASTGPLSGRVDGRVGIHDHADFGGRSPGDVQELIGPAATCSGCADPVRVGAGDTTPALPALPPAPCPDDDGVITGELAGGVAYECAGPGPITLTGTVGFGGPALLTFADGVDVHLDHAVVNPAGRPSAVVLHSASTSATAVTVTDSDLVGVLVVADGRLTTDGLRWEGAVVVGDLVTSPGSELTGTWSDDLETLGFGGWRVTEWRTTRS